MHRNIAIVPAAGNGSRVGADLPKQYLPLAGRPLLFHALAVLCASPSISEVRVILTANDSHWPQHDWCMLGPKLQVLHEGGATRAETVLAGLRSLAGQVDDEDWILVHDAARPCLSAELLEHLIRSLAGDAVGGILAIPVADTLKRADSGHRIAATVPREALWQAQTPQMFRYRLLCEALGKAGNVTDEAGAVEALGLRPRLVRGDATNLKVTFPADLALATWILQGEQP